MAAPVSACIPAFRYAAYDRPKEVLWEAHPFPEIPCIFSGTPVDFQTDLTADENGKAVHEHRYAKRITSVQSDFPAPIIVD